MKQIVKALLIIGVMLGLLQCATYHHFYSNYDRSIDFAQYKTFAWVPDSGAMVRNDSFRNTAYDNDIVRNNAKNYINHKMSERGYLVNVDSPDFVLQLVLLNEKMEKIITYNPYPYPYSGYYFYNRYYFPYYYPYYNYYTWNYPAGYWNNYSSTYTKKWVKGTITINMFDRRKEKLIWTGSAEGDIYDPAYIQFDVHPAIDRIMKMFPVKSKISPSEIEKLKFKNRVVRAGWEPRGLMDTSSAH